MWGPPLLLAPQMLYQCSCPWAGRGGSQPGLLGMALPYPTPSSQGMSLGWLSP